MPPLLTGLCPLLQVFDMQESVRFYREHLGFEIAEQSPRVEHPYPHFNWALLKRDGAELMLNTAYEADERPATRDPERRLGLMRRSRRPASPCSRRRSRITA
jgi:catechol 2,3-dioxygenase-like lactoylglutathione lyase family enzyme